MPEISSGLGSTNLDDWLTTVQMQWATQGLTGLDPSTVQHLQQLWQQLNPDQQQTLLKNLRQHATSPQDLQGAVGQAIKNQSASTAAEQAPPTQTVQGQGGQTLAVPSKPGDPYQATAAYGQVSPISYAAQPLLSSWGGTAGAAPSTLASFAGVDPALLQREYQDYVDHFRRAAGLFGGFAQQNPMSLQDFAQVKARAMQGRWQPLLDAFDYSWNEQYGQRLPTELRMQLLDALNKMDKNEEQAVLAAEATYVSGLQTAVDPKKSPGGLGPFLSSLTSTLLSAVPTHINQIDAQYAVAHPDIGKEVSKDAQIRQQNYIQWMQGHNVAITPDLLAKLAAMPASSSLTNPEPGSDFAYLLTLPSDIKGMTWGQKDIAMSNIGSQWRQYFGREPNAQELQWASGKNPTEIQDFVDNSPSHVPGVTIRRYQDYDDFINKIGTSGSTHAFSAGVDDSLIHDLHQHLTEQSTQASTPGPLPSA